MISEPAARERDARDRLERLLPADAPHRFRPEALVVNGVPAIAILEQASASGATLIVMGVQSRGAVDLMVFGSVTRGVIHGAQCPVVSVRANTTAEPAGTNQRARATAV